MARSSTEDGINACYALTWYYSTRKHLCPCLPESPGGDDHRLRVIYRLIGSLAPSLIWGIQNRRDTFA